MTKAEPVATNRDCSTEGDWTHLKQDERQVLPFRGVTTGCLEDFLSLFKENITNLSFNYLHIFHLESSS